MSSVFTLGLALVAAICYLAGSLVLKQWQVLPPVLAVVGGAAFLILAIVAEAAVLQRARFAEIITLIFVLEVVLALVLSHLVLGEVYGRREIIGLALLVLGVLVLFWQPAPVKPQACSLAKAPESRS